MKTLTTMQAMHAMKTGAHGHFAMKLADAWCYGDTDNQDKIEKTWADLIERVKRFESNAPTTV